MKTKISADEIRQALSEVYAPSEWYLSFEVGNSTGSNCRRHADAVAVNAYPSKGFEIRGFEIKVAKSDLKKELEDGDKSDAVAKFCDYWFLVAPKGLADDFTLPVTWGLIEYENGKLRQKIKPTRIEKIPPTAGFMCAMLRGRERHMEATARQIADSRAEEIKRNALWMVKNDSEELKLLEKKLAEIHEKTGIELNKWTPTDDIIQKLKNASALNVIARNVKHLEYDAKRFFEIAEKIKGAVDEMQSMGDVNE